MPNATRSGWKAPRAFAAGFLLALHAGTAGAGPEGGVVVAGQGQISRPDAGTTVIDQRSHNLAIDWQRFNVAPQELVRFNQPGSTASALNRIFDQNPSQILGRIQANGRVLLMNPNGIVFGAGARVQVGSLVAGALQADVAEFMAGHMRLEGLEGTDGIVVNQGLLQAATGGSVSLLGKAVRNEGVIIANAGKVNLLAGDRLTLDFDGDGLLRFAVDRSVMDNARSLDAAVSNSGEITADGGQVLLSGHAAQEVFTHTINNSGVIRAARIDRSGGKVRLVGLGPGASVLNTGSLTATGGPGESGGSVRVLGQQVTLAAGSRIDASGPAGGGEVLIGGDTRGASPEIGNAVRTRVEAGAVVRADATDRGDGGKVVVWADDTTDFSGAISARGGPRGGDGGFVEVSGKRHLRFDGSADRRAPAGSPGTLLLDPGSITVCNGAGCGNSTDTYEDAVIAAALATGNVILDTSAAGAPITPGGTSGSDNGLAQTVTFNTGTSIVWNAATAFTVNAGTDVTMNNATVTGSNAGSTFTVNFGQQNAGNQLDLGSSTITAAGGVTFNGGTGSDTIVGSTAGNAFVISGGDSGTVNGFTFTSVENLTGSNTADD
ncbi:MAG: filamentous hemagglutinin N-terminal domain-containing protein, partial [Gammaproteobacteria bacterium]